MVDRDAVVEVQLAVGGLVLVEGHDELKVVLAELGGGVCGLDAGGEDDARADEQGDVGDGLVGEGMGLAAVDDLVGVPVVEVVFRQVNIDGVGVFLEDGGDEKTGSVEELEVLGERVGVGGVVVEDGGEGGGAVLVGAVHGGVHVVEEAVADLNGLLGGFGDGGPAVEFLSWGAVLVVVAVEGVEGAEGGPARAELLGR